MGYLTTKLDSPFKNLDFGTIYDVKTTTWYIYVNCKQLLQSNVTM
jgi:hypothetical protein